MSEVKAKTAAKAPKLADPRESSIEPSTQEMIERAQQLGIDTVFDRAVTMKPCAIGLQGICCKNCAMGPCRLPLPKGGIEGEDTRKGLCGATANTICARNFARMIAAGASAHSDHGRGVVETFLSVARKETKDYKIKDPAKLIQIAPYFDVATTVEVDGETLDRDIDEIALGVAEAAAAEFGKVGRHPVLSEAGSETAAGKMEEGRRRAAGHRPRGCRDHASHPYGCRSGLQKPDEAGNTLFAG